MSSFPDFVRCHRRNLLRGSVLISTCLVALQLLGSEYFSLRGLQEGRSIQKPFHTATNKFCIFTKTAPDAFQLRQCQRSQCRPHYQDSTHLFVLGTPSNETRKVQAHKQGRLASKEEVIVSGNIILESDEFHDILVVPYRDFSINKSIKHLAAIKYGVEHNCSYTIIVDSQHCVDLTKLKETILSEENPDEELYFGQTMHTSNDTQNATNIHHYLSGGYSGVSLKLGSFIAGQGWMHAVMSGHVESNNADLNMGLWVQYAMKKHNVSVNYVAESLLLDEAIDETCVQKEEEKEKPTPKVSYNHDLCIVTLTSANYFNERQCQRRVCRPNYGDIPHKFIVGIPSDASKEDPILNANDTASEQEASVAHALVAEHDTYGDMLAAVHRDYYIDLPEKRMAILKFGVENKCAYTIKVDDEFCVNVREARKMIAAHEREHPDKEFYFGNGGFRGTEYESMKGAQGEHVPYFSGWCNGASYKLASYIVNEDWTHTVLRGHYGSSSEDVDMGFWVDYAMKKHDLLVDRAGNRAILRAISKGECEKSLNETSR